MAVMEAQFAWPGARLALKASQCGFQACHQLAAGEVEGSPFCLEHFIAAGLRAMAMRSGYLKERPADTAATGVLRDLLMACSRQAKALVENEVFANQPARVHLADVINLASELQKKLRRSPRIATSVPLWLRREDPRHTWEEETWTLTLSRHGAGLVCRHSVATNGRVVLCRRDKGNRAEARVIYSMFDPEGRRHMGVELVDRDDFWDFAQATPPGSVPSTIS